MTARCPGIGAADPASREAAEHLGPAWAYLGLLRALPLHARQKRCYLPADLCADAGVDLQEVFELRSSPALRRVCGVLAEAAGQNKGGGAAEAALHLIALARRWGNSGKDVGFRPAGDSYQIASGPDTA